MVFSRGQVVRGDSLLGHSREEIAALAGLMVHKDKSLEEHAEEDSDLLTESRGEDQTPPLKDIFL